MPPTIIKNPLKSYTDSLTVDQGHVMLTSHVPGKVGAKKFCEDYYAWKNPTPEAITQFGLFGSGLEQVS